MGTGTDVYGGYELRKGDKDSDKKWGGGIDPSGQGQFVTALQEDLKKLKIYIWNVDGDFGPNTERAVRMFKWNAKTLSRRVKDGTVVLDEPKLDTDDSGLVDSATAAEIQRWKANSFEATGDLIRLEPGRFNVFELGVGFKKIDHPNIQQSEFVVSDVLFDCLKMMDAKARELGVKIVINQTLRIAGTPVSGAVVTPATKSQHLIGHALDCNIVDGGNWNNVKAFKEGKQTQKARDFIKAVKASGMRWGGDFSQIDPPHFDKQLDANSDAYEFKYFFNQRAVSEKQPIPLKNG